MPVSFGTPSTTETKTEEKPATEDTKAPAGVFYKTPAEAQKTLEEADAKQQAEYAKNNRLWRYRIAAGDCGKDFMITFVDGELDELGGLTAPLLYEHTIPWEQGYLNIPCIAATEPCPVCEGGDKPALVQALTVIDHRPYTVKKGDNKGKIIPFSKKVFAMKSQSIKLLQKHASKSGGLVGVTFEVSRSTSNAAAVGDSFIMMQKNTPAELLETFGVDGNNEPLFVIANYDHELNYQTREQLAAIGIGANAPTLGSENGPTGDLGDEL